MVYLPSNGSYWAWYAGWQKNGSWELSESREINSEEIMQLISERGDVVSEVDR
jgi:hypothetical protein